MTMIAILILLPPVLALLLFRWIGLHNWHGE